MRLQRSAGANQVVAALPWDSARGQLSWFDDGLRCASVPVLCRDPASKPYLGRSGRRAVLAAAVASVLLLGSGCRRDTTAEHRLPYTYVVEIDAKRVWVDVVVNGLTVVRFPEVEDRKFGEYFSERASEEITAWIEPGSNEVVFRVTPADDSGKQHRELEVRRALFRERRREELFASESREVGETRVEVVHDSGASASCDPLTDADRQEVLRQFQGLYDAIAAGDFERYRAFFPPDGEIAEVFGPVVKHSWEVSEGRPPTISPLRMDDLEVRKKCDADAVFITSKTGAELFRYAFVSPDGRASSRNAFRSVSLRNGSGRWVVIY